MNEPRRLALPDRTATPRLTDHASEYATYRVDVPDRFNAVVDIVDRWARDEPDALALVSIDPSGEVASEHAISELSRAAEAMARALVGLGIGHGDRVLVMLPRVAEWYLVLLGAMRIGAVAVPTPNQATSRDRAYRVDAARPAVLVADPNAAEKVDAIDRDLLAGRLLVCVGPERAGWQSYDSMLARSSDVALPADPTSSHDPLIMFFTSGTVGYPKMVLHGHEYALGHVATARFWLDLRPGDRHWTVSDTGWAKAAWGGLFGQWHERATVVQVELQRPTPDNVLSILAKHAITSFCAPPTLYRMLVQADLTAHDLSTLRHCTSAGEPLNPQVIATWQQGTGGLVVREAYGQSETTCLVANYRSVPIRPGSMGLPVPGYVVDVVDDDGRPIEVGGVGNIAVRTDPRPVGLFSEYVDNPSAMSASFNHGWYFTGDKAAKDDDGYIWFESRADDIITSSAYRIGPFEVESALVEHPAVVEAAVVGKDDPERTQIVCAFVVLAAGFDASDELVASLQAHVKAVTAPYKYPREVRFVAELPKTISGKIRRTELRSTLRQGDSR